MAVGEGLTKAGHGIKFGDFLTDPFVTGNADVFPVEGFSGDQVLKSEPMHWTYSVRGRSWPFCTKTSRMDS